MYTVVIKKIGGWGASLLASSCNNVALSDFEGGGGSSEGKKSRKGFMIAACLPVTCSNECKLFQFRVILIVLIHDCV